MRLKRGEAPRRISFGFVHAQTIVPHARSHGSPYANFREEDTYMPTGNVSHDTHCAVVCYGRT